MPEKSVGAVPRCAKGHKQAVRSSATWLAGVRLFPKNTDA